jgi:hypothetical protein
MYLEDLIEKFADTIGDINNPLGKFLMRNDWSCKFLTSLNNVVSDDRALSTKQVEWFVKIIKDLGDIPGYSPDEQAGLLQFLDCPRFRIQPYTSVPLAKEVRYLGDNKLGFRCKLIEEIIAEIKALGNRGADASWKDYQRPIFNRQHRMWVVTVTRDSFKSIMNIIGTYDFHYDDTVAEYLALCDSSFGGISTFVIDSDSDKIIANICDNMMLEGWVKRVLFGEVL